jgi:prepilin-type N-terminal cleavage/methylation domain-containing protein
MATPRRSIDSNPRCPTRLGIAPPATAGPARQRRGLTLVEVLLTIAVLAILATVLIPRVTSDLPERLQAAAQIVTADLDYARSLAVANNSRYRVTFEPDHNRYCLRHSGSLAALNTLPRSPFRQNNDAADQQTTDFSELPLPKPTVQLLVVMRMQSGGQSTDQVEFTPLGGTTAPQETVLWLACGSGSQRRYISIHVNPQTGLAEAGPLVAGLPATVVNIAAQNAATANAAATPIMAVEANVSLGN